MNYEEALRDLCHGEWKLSLIEVLDTANMVRKWMTGQGLPIEPVTLVGLTRLVLEQERQKRVDPC